MMTLDWRLPLLGLMLGLCFGGFGAWQWQANSFGKQIAENAEAWQREREQSAQAVIDWQEAQQTQRRELEERLQTNDQTHYKEQRDAQNAQARLRDRIATADLRLSVLLTNIDSGSCAVPADPCTGYVVHGATRAELDPAHAQRIVAITGDGDQGLIALKACQAYVKEVSATK